MNRITFEKSVSTTRILAHMPVMKPSICIPYVQTTRTPKTSIFDFLKTRLFLFLEMKIKQ